MNDEARSELHKAMAAAMRAKDQELHNRPKWDPVTRWIELAQAADDAARKYRDGGDS